jgi:hypothetical protein
MVTKGIDRFSTTQAPDVSYTVARCQLPVVKKEDFPYFSLVSGNRQLVTGVTGIR